MTSAKTRQEIVLHYPKKHSPPFHSDFPATIVGNEIQRASTPLSSAENVRSQLPSAACIDDCTVTWRRHVCRKQVLGFFSIPSWELTYPISHPKGSWEDEFPFPFGGICMNIMDLLVFCWRVTLSFSTIIQVENDGKNNSCFRAWFSTCMMMGGVS